MIDFPISLGWTMLVVGGTTVAIRILRDRFPAADARLRAACLRTGQYWTAKLRAARLRRFPPAS